MGLMEFIGILVFVTYLAGFIVDSSFPPEMDIHEDWGIVFFTFFGGSLSNSK
jgi:hypothetical protein